MADVLGHLIVDVLAGQGVDVSSASFDRTASTGLMVREERSALRTVVHYVRTASAGSRLTTEDVPAFGPGDHLHLTGITPALGESARATAEAGMQRAIERGVGVSLDVNYRASLWSRDDARSVLSTLARAATVLFASEDELDLLGTDVRLPADDVIDSLMEAGVQTLVVKRGRLGARLTDASGTIDEPGVDVPVVDPVGAGDAFVAGFLSRVACGAPPADCLRMAVLASAHAVTVQGDYEGMPEPADLAFLAGTERGVQR